MSTPSLQTFVTDASQVLNLGSISAVRSVVAVALANANAGTPLNPNLTTQQLWNEFYQVVTEPKSNIESFIANQMMKFFFSPPAPGGVGADKQVIFNDGGVLAGDAGLVYNKTTDALTVAGLVTAGSATITGDLTVATSSLKVTGSQVGIGTATPGGLLELYKNTNGQNRLFLNNPSTGNNSYISVDFTAGISNNQILSIGSGNAAAFPYTAGTLSLRSGSVNGMIINTGGSAAPIQFGINDTLAMTLNSTGLGVGVTPSAWASGYKAIQGQIGGFALSNDNSSNNQFRLSSNAYFDTTDSRWEYFGNSTATAYEQRAGEHRFFNAVSGSANTAIPFTQAMTLTAAGDLLVGTVTAPTGTKIGSIAKLSSVSIEGTAPINVSTTPVALARNMSVGGLYFISGYNTTGGAQGWFLVASQQATAPTVIASGNSTGLVVAFTNVAGVLNMNTVAGTIQITAISLTN